VQNPDEVVKIHLHTLPNRKKHFWSKIDSRIKARRTNCHKSSNFGTSEINSVGIIHNSMFTGQAIKELNICQICYTKKG